MWPKSFWYKVYEPFIRKAAGLGVASTNMIKKDMNINMNIVIY
jgi:sarcosine oxidase subunit alpha